MASEPICDLKALDFSKPLFTIEGIRAVNPQRFEMEQLTAIVHVDQSQHLIVGYKQVSDSEFWSRGHMPGYPLMPGVVQCEAAAQVLDGDAHSAPARVTHGAERARPDYAAQHQLLGIEQLLRRDAELARERG